MKKKTTVSKSVKKYGIGGTNRTTPTTTVPTTPTTTVPVSKFKVPSYMKVDPKTISPNQNSSKKSQFGPPPLPSKPIPPSYGMKKGGSVTKSKKR